MPIVLVWFLWLLYFLRKDFKKIILLVVGGFLQILGAFLIFQDGIKADEQGLGGNIFGNPIALSSIGMGLIIVVILTGLLLLKKSNTINS